MTLGLVGLSVWLMIGFVGQVISIAQMERHRESLQAEVAQIEATNAALRNDVEYAESPAYTEQVLREQLGYAREGDTVILPTLPEPTVPPADQSTTPVPTVQPAPNWRGWLRAFFPPASDP